MATFDAGQTEIGQIRDHSTVKEPFIEEPVALVGLTNLFAQAGDLIDNATDKKKKEVVSSFRGELLKMANAVDQGKISPQAARSKMRVLYMQNNENYASLGGELANTYSQVLAQTGMGAIVNDAMKGELRRTQLVDSLTQAGMVGPGASRTEEDAAISAFRTAQTAKQQFETALQTVTLAKSKADLTTSQAAANQAKLKQSATNFAYSQVPILSQSLQKETDRLLEEIQTQGLTTAEAQVQFEEIYQTGIEGQQEVLKHLDQDDRNQLESVFERRKELALKKLTGSLELEDYERQLKRLDVETELTIRQADPRFSKFMVLSDILGDNLVNILVATNNIDALNMAADIFNEQVEEGDMNPFPKDSAATRTYLEILKNADTSTDEGKEQLTQQLRAVIGGVEEAQQLLEKDPKRGKAIIEFMASTQFLKSRQENPDAFPDGVDGAIEVLERNYADEIYGLVAREFTNKKVTDYSDPALTERMGIPRPQLDTDSLVGVETTPTGFRFSANPDLTGGAASTAESEARRLNRELAPILNQTIRAMSHLEGGNNYQQAAEQALSRIFQLQGAGGDVEAPGGDADDDLDMKDFLGGLADVEPISLEEVDSSLMGLGEGPGFTNGRTIKPEGMIIHHTGGRGTAKTVKTVLEERGLSVQFVVDRNGNIHQLMPDTAEAWHAGKNNDSGFDNKNTIGVEVIANDNDDVLPEQIEATKRLIKMLSEKHGFDPSTNVFGHGEVATYKQATEGQSIVGPLRNAT